MKFLTDENVATSVVKSLRDAGHDVKDVKEERLQGSSDQFLLHLAERELRIIVTHDKDFAQLSHIHAGIILIRLRNQKPENVLKILLKILSSDMKSKIERSLAVVSEDTITFHKIL
jgi:predicted nuclease of predicted toxin-antitoxin system